LRQAHTIKGLAGNIGATTLADAARQLESALKNTHADADSGLPALLDGYERALQDVILTLDTRLAPPAQPPALPTTALDPQQLSALCKRIEQLLVNSDAEANAEWEKHADVLRQGLGEDFGAIDSAIEDFEYETALERLHLACLARIQPLDHQGEASEV
jgi:two-component system sensor histidine kinase/response regulator